MSNSTKMPMSGCGYSKGGKVSKPKVPSPSKMSMLMGKKKGK